jgi:hypothetical protein
MSEKLLTIGMATYDDYDGVYFTIQALRMHQLKGIEDKVEIIVIDNNPTSKYGKEVKTFVEGFAKGKYIPYIERQSTFVKYDIFKYASGKYTLCIDCHVMFEENAIKNLLEYYEKNPDTKNLIQGPLLNDDLKNISTHFDPIWRDRMYGIWACNRIEYQKNEPFEIPMMGMGVFSCKTDSFPNINNNFKGFGGEEGYIAEKFRQNGGNNICLPNFKWIHRFIRPSGVPYRNNLEDRVFNYFLGWLEILQDENHPFFQKIIDAFKENISEEKIKDIFNKAKQIVI